MVRITPQDVFRVYSNNKGLVPRGGGWGGGGEGGGGGGTHYISLGKASYFHSLSLSGMGVCFIVKALGRDSNLERG